ncbi:MAG: hypothetical protein WBA74_22340 [Cyclobacteriaceae bacterium]
MKTSMLEYSKIILSKVSFDRRIFLKEYKKFHNTLVPEESMELKHWVRSNIYPYSQKQVLNRNLIER